MTWLKIHHTVIVVYRHHFIDEETKTLKLRDQPEFAELRNDRARLQTEIGSQS